MLEVREVGSNGFVAAMAAGRDLLSVLSCAFDGSLLVDTPFLIQKLFSNTIISFSFLQLCLTSPSSITAHVVLCVLQLSPLRGLQSLFS